MVKQSDFCFSAAGFFLSLKIRDLFLFQWRLRIRRMCAGGGEKQLGVLAITDGYLHQQLRATPSLHWKFFFLNETIRRRLRHRSRHRPQTACWGRTCYLLRRGSKGSRGLKGCSRGCSIHCHLWNPWFLCALIRTRRLSVSICGFCVPFIRPTDYPCISCYPWSIIPVSLYFLIRFPLRFLAPAITAIYVRSGWLFWLRLFSSS